MTFKSIVPYLIALGVAGLVIAGGILFVTSTRRGVLQQVERYKADLRAKQKAGTLPPEWRGRDIENLDARQIQMRVSSEAQTFLDIAELLITFRLALIAAVVMLALAAAWVVSRWRGVKVTDSPSPTASPAVPTR
jgi:hypothetical protein